MTTRTKSAIGLLLAAGVLTAAVASRRDDADALIAGRQAAMKLSGATFGGMKATIDAGGDVTKLAFPAKALAEWAHATPGMFPAGSDGGTSKALPTVWSDPAGFAKASAALEAAATKLGDLAKAGDAPGVAAQWAVVRGTCGACHDTYRQPDKPRG
ncbi:cytochrome c [Sphingomonas panacisoli]|uniref:Cytochrome c n=1 Tax=Sphingomonas panacisoli TaxID=1813879 RepID=A0A5B8LFQ9_9SPHN|nr:cytochrome c [Sphingomonas panacisoli]QDZ06699.1 cytochrome c [Sphingomonas panacisoli]